MQLRNKGKHTTEVNEKIMGAADETEETDRHLAKDRALNDMELALQQLNKEQQVCVTLFYLEKKSYQEIAEQTSYNLMQVKSHIQNGKRNLRILMERK